MGKEEEFYKKFETQGIKDSDFKEKFPNLYNEVRRIAEANSYTNENGILIHYFGPTNQVYCSFKQLELSHTFNLNNHVWPNRHYQGPMFQGMTIQQLVNYSIIN